jgi:leucyl aminopeptidase
VDFLVDLAGTPSDARELWLVPQADLARWLDRQPAPARAWLESTGFKAEKQQLALLPGADGLPQAAALGLGPLGSLDSLELWQVAGLPERLPAATTWRAANALSPTAATALALGWAYGSYRFDTYKTPAKTASVRPRLIAPAGADHALVLRIAAATAMARDFINMPASDMTPERRPQSSWRAPTAPSRTSFPGTTCGVDSRRYTPSARPRSTRRDCWTSAGATLRTRS